MYNEFSPGLAFVEEGGDSRLFNAIESMDYKLPISFTKTNLTKKIIYGKLFGNFRDKICSFYIGVIYGDKMLFILKRGNLSYSFKTEYNNREVINRELWKGILKLTNPVLYVALRFRNWRWSRVPIGDSE